MTLPGEGRIPEGTMGSDPAVIIYQSKSNIHIPMISNMSLVLTGRFPLNSNKFIKCVCYLNENGDSFFRINRH